MCIYTLFAIGSGQINCHSLKFVLLRFLNLKPEPGNTSLQWTCDLSDTKTDKSTKPKNEYAFSENPN